MMEPFEELLQCEILHKSFEELLQCKILCETDLGKAYAVHHLVVPAILSPDNSVAFDYALQQNCCRSNLICS